LPLLCMSEIISGMAVFVMVDKGNILHEHGFKLPAEYIAEHRRIYEEAINARK